MECQNISTETFSPTTDPSVQVCLCNFTNTCLDDLSSKQFDYYSPDDNITIRFCLWFHETSIESITAFNVTSWQGQLVLTTRDKSSNFTTACNDSLCIVETIKLFSFATAQFLGPDVRDNVHSPIISGTAILEGDKEDRVHGIPYRKTLEFKGPLYSNDPNDGTSNGHGATITSVAIISGIAVLFQSIWLLMTYGCRRLRSGDEMTSASEDDVNGNINNDFGGEEREKEEQNEEQPVV